MATTKIVVTYKGRTYIEEVPVTANVPREVLAERAIRRIQAREERREQQQAELFMRAAAANVKNRSHHRWAFN